MVRLTSVKRRELSWNLNLDAQDVWVLSSSCRTWIDNPGCLIAALTPQALLLHSGMTQEGDFILLAVPRPGPWCFSFSSCFWKNYSLLGSVVFCLLQEHREESRLTTLNTQMGSSAIHLGQSDLVKWCDLNVFTKTKKNLASAQAAFGHCCFWGKWEKSQKKSSYFLGSEMFANTDTVPMEQIEVMEVH